MRGKVTWSLPLWAALLAATPSAAAGDPVPSTVTIVVKKGEHIDFLAGKTLVGRYHIAPTVAKPYFWPLNGPSGAPVTRGWPMVAAEKGGTKDHVHQKSLWFCHGDVIPEGLEVKQKVKGVKGVDFWSEHKGHGRMVCTKVEEKPRVKGNHGRITTWNEWRTADGEKIMDETRTIHLYTLGDAQLLVFDIDLHASVVPITFGDTKEGALGVRVHDALREKGGTGKLVNADGKEGMAECWGQKSVWCDYSGTIDGKAVGVAIFDHPNNPHPALWHSRDYGLMAANPFGREVSKFPATRGRKDLVKVDKGKHLKLRYGVLIHPGDVKEGKVAEHYKEFSTMKD